MFRVGNININFLTLGAVLGSQNISVSKEHTQTSLDAEGHNVSSSPAKRSVDTQGEEEGADTARCPRVGNVAANYTGALSGSHRLWLV